MFPLVYVLSLLLLLFFFFKLKYFNRSSSKKNLPPSPPRLPVIGNLHQIGPLIHHSLHSLSQTHGGPVMLIHLGSVPTLVVSSAEAAREIMKTQDLMFANRPDVKMWRKLLCDLKEVSIAPYGEYWRQVKSIMILHLLSNKKIGTYRQVRDEEIALVVKKIENYSNKVVDLSDLFVKFTNDVVCRVTFGNKYSEGENGKKFRKMLSEFFEVLGGLNLGDLLPKLAWVDRVRGFDAKVERVANELGEFLNGVVEERLRKQSTDAGGGGGGENFVDILLKIQKDDNIGVTLDRLAIKALLLDFWNLKVRVIRRWEQSYRLDVLLIDEKGQKIQAFVKDKLISDFQNKLKEDAVLVIKKCGIAEQKDKFPVILSKKKINFYRCTEVSEAVGFRGHPYGFAFTSFSEINEKLAKEVHTVDVIGNVVSCGNLDVFKNKLGKENNKINFALQDLQGNVVNCTLWDGYAAQFSTYISNHKSNEHVISIIQHGKLKSWRDELTVQNDKYGTRLFINDEIEEINYFRRSLILNEAGITTSQSQLSSQTVYPLRNEFLVNTQRKHVDEIRECEEIGDWIVVGTIRMIEEEFGWFYAGCRKCTKKVLTKSEYLAIVDTVSKELEGAPADSLWCPRCKCQSTSVVPKYRIQFRVQDDTGSISFLMFDKDVARLVGLSAADIRDRQMKSGDMESFPHEINNYMVNKLLAFKVVVSQHNLKKTYNVYTVQKLCADPELITALMAQDLVQEVNDDQDTVDGSCVKLDESSQYAVDSNSKDAVSVTGSSLAQKVEKGIENDTETSPVGKRPIQAASIGKPADGDCSATKRTRKKLQPYNV